MSHQSQRNVNDVVRYKQNLARNLTGVVSTADYVIRGIYRVIFFAEPRFKPERGEISIHVIMHFILLAIRNIATNVASILADCFHFRDVIKICGQLWSLEQLT